MKKRFEKMGAKPAEERGPQQQASDHFAHHARLAQRPGRLSRQAGEQDDDDELEKNEKKHLLHFMDGGWSALCRRNHLPLDFFLPVKSGRAFLVFNFPCSLRQVSIWPWWPERRMSGTFMPRNSAGRVYWGYSSSPCENDSRA